MCIVQLFFLEPNNPHWYLGKIPIALDPEKAGPCLHRG